MTASQLLDRLFLPVKREVVPELVIKTLDVGPVDTYYLAPKSELFGSLAKLSGDKWEMMPDGLSWYIAKMAIRKAIDSLPDFSCTVGKHSVDVLFEPPQTGNGTGIPRIDKFKAEQRDENLRFLACLDWALTKNANRDRSMGNNNLPVYGHR